MMYKNVARIRATNDLATLSVIASSRTGESLTSKAEELKEEIGRVVISTPKRDGESIQALKDSL